MRRQAPLPRRSRWGSTSTPATAGAGGRQRHRQFSLVQPVCRTGVRRSLSFVFSAPRVGRQIIPIRGLAVDESGTEETRTYGLWTVLKCEQIIYNELEKNLKVCPEVPYPAHERAGTVGQLIGEGVRGNPARPRRPPTPQFRRHLRRPDQSRKKTGSRTPSSPAGSARWPRPAELTVAVLVQFMGGMGSVVGKSHRTIEQTVDKIPTWWSLPPGPRMRRASVVVPNGQDRRGAGPPGEPASRSFPLVTDPTTGRVTTASFAMLGDIIIAEARRWSPRRPRVIGQTIQTLPQGFPTVRFC